MYLRLKDKFVLRGWEGIPYGMTDTGTGRTMLLDTITFQAASFCDGKTDLASPLILPAHKEAIDKLVKEGIAGECAGGEGLAGHQKYRRTEARFADSVHWSITGKCNLRCRHCFLSAPQAKYGELTTEQCLEIIDQIAGANIGKVSLTGGEPLVRRDFWQLVDALREKRIAIHQLYTNGVLVTDELLQQLQTRGIKCGIYLSFDCCGCHDWLRGVTGAEQAAIAAIKRARRHGFEVGIETALHKDNLNKLAQTYELLKALGISSWKISPTMSVGNWAHEQGQYDIPIKDLYDAYLQLIKKHHGDGAPFALMLGGFYYCGKENDQYIIPLIKYDGTEKALRQTVCRSCRINLYIMADGRLLPCIPMTGTYMEKEMPNLLTTTITEAMNSSRYFDIIDTRLEKLFRENNECAGCEHKLKCGMGCRANAINCSGSFYGVDAGSCYFFKNRYEEKIKKIF
ncbi:radical SAM additional 4Fe4S-binding SPASM domain-containing protein [Desulfotomaculum arcticum]|uniref:Radical SAM additional 4Fe4S-binding SPASM domain-containing protein n=1 Tax=Desulfotruncus arcticus DSM 17038 TaxID=1121424 RepID=A0A1I2PB55_9FIRM|nr:radical SAM protein [Desulfotruncus arcticus]SFG13365.1 radical SAM additional 4Fe4S-binding SPASM domain-containing protein [Desulfotomaculum arcticum] [Desulfotruncus arcticus DSM 17038]